MAPPWRNTPPTAGCQGCPVGQRTAGGGTTPVWCMAELWWGLVGAGEVGGTTEHTAGVGGSMGGGVRVALGWSMRCMENQCTVLGVSGQRWWGGGQGGP